MAETAKIRVNVEVIELEVNDNGDTIKLPVSDEMFMKRLYDFIDRVSEESKKLDNLDLEDIAGTIEKDIQFHEMIKEQFNILFGDKAYEKVFGSDIVVGAEYILEFLEQCMPYIQKYVDKREQRLTKYSANRVGSSL